MFHFQLVQQWWQKLPESLLWIPLLCHSKLSGIREQWVCPEPSCLRGISGSLLQFIHNKPIQRMESGTLRRLRTSFSTQRCLFCYSSHKTVWRKDKATVIYTVDTSCLIQLGSGKFTVNEPSQLSPEKHAYHFQRANDEGLSHLLLPSLPIVCNIILLHIWQKG